MLEFNAEWVSSREGATEWMAGSNHYLVTLADPQSGSLESFYYSQGPAVKGEPDLDGVMHCLLSDYDAGSMDFEEFCSEFGYDSDSRKAYATWQSCVDATAKLDRLLSASEIEEWREKLQDY